MSSLPSEKSILFIVRRAPGKKRFIMESLLDETSIVVLGGDGVEDEELETLSKKCRVYYLREDSLARGREGKEELITYDELVDLIFGCSKVIVL